MKDNGNGVVAYFTPEIALDQNLPIYSGGLGVIAASLAKSFREMDIPAIVVSILAREGYYDQYVEEIRNGTGEVVDYKMGIRYKRWEREEEFLEDTCVIVPINLSSSLNVIKVWKVKDMFNSVPVYLLDTDIPPNNHMARLNTRHLYGGTMHGGVNWDDLERRRLAQYYILGKGGVKALRRLNINVTKYHLNESHSYFAAQEILSGALKSGMSWTDAVIHTKSKVCFTTHTPAASGHGHQVFPFDEVVRMANINGKGLSTNQLLMLGGDSLGKFNMTMACFHLAGIANTVSKKHFVGTKNMWGFLEGAAPIINITNAVNHRHLQYEDFRNAQTPKKKDEVKIKYKRLLIEKYAPGWNESVFTLGWGRRGQAYKRMKLIIHGDNYRWLSNLMKENKIQVIMGGKPHPDDQERIKDWEELYKLSKSPDFPKLVVVPGYELDMMKEWSAGVDSWLNTPRSSCEASGTSGMKGNGAINCSTPDGWEWEANQENYFPFGSDSPIDLGTHDTHDAQDLQRAANDMLTIFYHSRGEWIQKVLASDREVETDFDSNPRAVEYAAKLYGLKV